MTSDAQKTAIKTYWERFVELRIRVTPPQKERYKKAAKNEGKSLTQFVIDCIEEHIKSAPGRKIK